MKHNHKKYDNQDLKPKRSFLRFLSRHNKLVVLLGIMLLGTIILIVILSDGAFDSVTSNNQGERHLELIHPQNAINSPFKLLEEGFTDTLVVDENSAILVAKEAVKLLDLGNVGDELSVKSVDEMDGVSYYRLQQNYNGLPFIGKTMTVVAGSEGEVLGFSSNVLSENVLDFGDFISQEIIERKVNDYLRENKVDYIENSCLIEKCSKDNRAYIETDDGIKQIYLLKLYRNNIDISFETVVVNAITGDVMWLENSFFEIDQDVYNFDKSIRVSGNYDEKEGIYQLKNNERNIEIYTCNGKDSLANNWENYWEIVGDKKGLITSENDVFGDTEDEINEEYSKAIQFMDNTARIYDFYSVRLLYSDNRRLCACYNEGSQNGENAFGGPAGGINYLTIGYDFGVDSLDVMAHEYSHIVTNRIVGWNNVSDNKKDVQPEYEAINEGISDIFGTIIEGVLNKTQTKWELVGRNMKEPSKSTDKNDKDKPKIQQSRIGEMPLERALDGNDYQHGFSTIISHCAYLMSNGVNQQFEPIDLADLTKLWFRTLFLIPSNCTYTALRKHMCQAALILDFSSEKLECVNAAFDEVNIFTEEEIYGTSSMLQILDKEMNEYANCTVYFVKNDLEIIDISSLLDNETNAYIVDYSDDNKCMIDLEEGDYFVFVKNQYGEIQQLEEPIKIRNDANFNSIKVVTDFLDNKPQIEKDIVIVMDISASMNGESIELAKRSSANFVAKTLDANTRIGVVTYRAWSEVVSELSNDAWSLVSAISKINAATWESKGNGTNITVGLRQAKELLMKSSAKKRIIVLVSDGEPSEGYSIDELKAFANSVKQENIKIFAIGLLGITDTENILTAYGILVGNEYETYLDELANARIRAEHLLKEIANEGSYYKANVTSEMENFYEDITAQLDGRKYMYIRITGPVDVMISFGDSMLCSAKNNLITRSGFGTLTFEEVTTENQTEAINQAKVFRLIEGLNYDVRIVGINNGLMDYTIGFMDEDGDYSDIRRFENNQITNGMVISSVATASKETILNVDVEGDGVLEAKVSAIENGYGVTTYETRTVRITLLVCAGLVSGMYLINKCFIRRKSKI